VVILRHPVDRAYSHYLMNRGRGCESAADLAEAIALADGRAARGWGWDWQYAAAGHYHVQLARFYARFPREQIKVFLYEDLKDAPAAFFAELFTFLGVDPAFRPDLSVRHRKASLPKSYLLQDFVKEPSMAKKVLKRFIPPDARTRAKTLAAAWNAKAPERLDPALRRDLFDRYFAEDCRGLEAQIGRSVAPWFQ